MKSSCPVANASPQGRWDAMGPKLPKRSSHLSSHCGCLTHLRTSLSFCVRAPAVVTCGTKTKNLGRCLYTTAAVQVRSTGILTHPPLPLYPYPCCFAQLLTSTTSELLMSMLAHCTCSGWDFLRWYSLPFGTAGWTRQFMFIFKVVRPENLQKQWQPATLAQDRNKRREQLQGVSRVNLSRGRSRHI